MVKINFANAVQLSSQNDLVAGIFLVVTYVMESCKVI